jgi:hypothetical protein
MREVNFATGQQIYDAAVEGAKRKYNRSTDNHSIYEVRLEELYEFMLKDLSKQIEKSVRKNTDNSWRKTFLPIEFLMYHKHIQRKESEVHVRIMLSSQRVSVIDIPLECWEAFERQTIAMCG